MRSRLRGRGAGLALGVLAAATFAVPSAQAKTPWSIVPDIPTGGHVHASAVAHAANLPFNGGTVLHSNRTHLIFWQPAGLPFDKGYIRLVERFMRRVASDSHKTTNVYSLSGQYTDGGGAAAYASTYGGAIVDSDPLPANGCAEPPLRDGGPGWPVCLLDAQLETELGDVINRDHLPTTGRDIYFLLTPNRFGDCEDTSPSDGCALGGPDNNGYCGYHASTQSNIVYAVIPYNALPGHCQSDNPRPNHATADPALSSLSHEHNEMVTDPYGDGWIDGDNQEDGDLCIENDGPSLGGSGSGQWDEVIGGGHYYLQEEWSNATGRCEPRARPDWASFALAGGAAAGRPVSFTAHTSDADGWVYGFAWAFGDGVSGHGKRPAHVYANGGRYRVTLRTTDSWGLWAYGTRAIQVGAAHPARRQRPRKR